MLESPINLTELANPLVNSQEGRDMPSQNHSLIQARLGVETRKKLVYNYDSVYINWSTI
jgi:hypothetical protein